jgi:hypothetical protein
VYTYLDVSLNLAVLEIARDLLIQRVIGHLMSYFERIEIISSEKNFGKLFSTSVNGQ